MGDEVGDAPFHHDVGILDEEAPPLGVVHRNCMVKVQEMTLV